METNSPRQPETVIIGGQQYDVVHEADVAERFQAPQPLQSHTTTGVADWELTVRGSKGGNPQVRAEGDLDQVLAVLQRFNGAPAPASAPIYAPAPHYQLPRTEHVSSQAPARMPLQLETAEVAEPENFWPFNSPDEAQIAPGKPDTTTDRKRSSGRLVGLGMVCLAGTLPFVAINGKLSPSDPGMTTKATLNAPLAQVREVQWGVHSAKTILHTVQKLGNFIP